MWRRRGFVRGVVGLSLTLALTTAVCWGQAGCYPVCSVLRSGQVGSHEFGCTIGSGGVAEAHHYSPGFGTVRRSHHQQLWPWNDRYYLKTNAGPGLNGRTWHYIETCLPMWMPLMIFSICPAVALIIIARKGQVRRQRHRLGFCVNCGYDLSGSVSGVCPECGEKV
jgi:hypothetical protein